MKPALPEVHLLKPVCAKASSRGETQVSVAFQLEESQYLRTRFKVEGSSLYANDEFDDRTSQWGLWDWDVVEVFLGFRERGSEAPVLPYYEFQLSPFNQFFELKILKPRQTVDKSIQTGFWHHVQLLSSSSWIAEMRLPLMDLGWNPREEQIYGNAFSILGSDRGHWALFGDPQEEPDFHRPERFERLPISLQGDR